MRLRVHCLIAVIVLVGCGGGEPEPSISVTSGSNPYDVKVVDTKEWYEGGDLHRASIGQWRAASYENRLATSADMVANLKKFTSLETMRSAAEEMETCVSKAAEGSSGEQSVTEVAAACALLMGYR